MASDHGHHKARERIYLCVDLGASGGRVMAARFDGARVVLDEVARFENRPVSVNGSLHWDIDRLADEVTSGIAGAARTYGRSIVSVGVAGWGVDYGLVDEAGRVLAHPHCYRDARTSDTPSLVFGRLDEREWFHKTGVATSAINTLFQLAWAAEHEPSLISRAERALLISDLVGHQLSGEPATELTIASTTQMMDIRTHEWLRADLERVGVPQHLLGDPVSSGTVTSGPNSPISREVEVPISVVAVAGHDTASAFIGSGATAGEAILSSGTWALMGVNSDDPHTDDAAHEAGFTNEIGADGRVRTLRNLTGFWILQECARSWRETGHDVDIASLIVEAEEAPAFGAVVDTSDPRFAAPGDMPQRIIEFCEESHQPPPPDRGSMTRVILEGLALQFRRTSQDLERIVGRDIEGIRVVGGGAHNRLLNRFVASATGLPVTVGPSEATSLGIALVQLDTHGEIAGLDEAPHVVANSHRHHTFPPVPDDRWDEAAARLESIST